MTGTYKLVDFDSDGNVDTVYGEFTVDELSENPQLTAGDKELIEIDDHVDHQENDITNVGEMDSQAVSTGEILNSDYNESVEVHATASGTVTLDLSVANVHHVEATGDVTLEFENATEGTGNSLLVYLVDDDATGPHTISWPASVVWSDGEPVDEIPAEGDVEVSLLSGDGSEWRGRESGRQFA